MKDWLPGLPSQSVMLWDSLCIELKRVMNGLALIVQITESPGKDPSYPSTAYRNPIFIAQEWHDAILMGKYTSQADLAIKNGFSRARVTQILRLLRLSPDVQCAINALGDPLPFPVVTERMLRPIVGAKPEIQKEIVKRILADFHPDSRKA
jgi:hypothetical protein